MSKSALPAPTRKPEKMASTMSTFDQRQNPRPDTFKKDHKATSPKHYFGSKQPAKKNEE